MWQLLLQGCTGLWQDSLGLNTERLDTIAHSLSHQAVPRLGSYTRLTFQVRLKTVERADLMPRCSLRYSKGKGFSSAVWLKMNQQESL